LSIADFEYKRLWTALGINRYLGSRPLEDTALVQPPCPDSLKKFLCVRDTTTERNMLETTPRSEHSPDSKTNKNPVPQEIRQQANNSDAPSDPLMHFVRLVRFYNRDCRDQQRGKYPKVQPKAARHINIKSVQIITYIDP